MCLFQVLIYSQMTLIHQELMYESDFYIFCCRCVTAPRLLHLFPNVPTLQSTNQLMVFMCIDCFKIYLNGILYQSECTSGDNPSGLVAKTLPCNLGGVSSKPGQGAKNPHVSQPKKKKRRT